MLYRITNRTEWELGGLGMKLTGNFFVLAVFLIFGQTVSAAPVTILSQQSFWDYNVTGTNFGPNGLASVDYAGFLAEYTGASNGQAGFGNTTPPAGGATNTAWNVGDDLALQTTTTLSGNVIGDVTLNVAIDNGAKVFINGTDVFFADAGGYTTIWEYTTTISGSLFNAGLNTISVLASDYGGLTFFDMQLVAEDGIGPPSAVPVPAAVWLFGTALFGLVGFSKRRNLA